MGEIIATWNDSSEKSKMYRHADLITAWFYLQILDLLTTVAFLAHGVSEANPLVRLFMTAGAGPLTGLLLIKSIAVALGFYCWKCERARLLGRANSFFAALVVWNLVALILRAV